MTPCRTPSTSETTSGDKRTPAACALSSTCSGRDAPDDGAADVVVPEYPRQGELAQAHIGRHRAQLVHGIEDFLVHQPPHKPAGLGVGGAGAPLGGLSRTILAGEYALGERREDHLAYTLALA